MTWWVVFNEEQFEQAFAEYAAGLPATESVPERPDAARDDLRNAIVSFLKSKPMKRGGHFHASEEQQ